jgi:TolB-like protein/Tfp pilus assembly protein PilF
MGVPNQPPEPGQARLDSWKDIAVYLKRSVSTVQRWEKHEGLPVHRLQHGKLGSLYAYPLELDAWWSERRLSLEQEPPEPDDRPPEQVRDVAGTAAPAREQKVSVPGSRRGKPALAAGALTLLAIALGYLLLGRTRRVEPPRQPITALAVLPLRNISGDVEEEYFADGLTEALITDLSKIRALKVISRTSAMQYKGANKSLPQIARELGVDGVIEGSVQRSGGRVVITAQLIRAATDTHLWAERYERDQQDLLQLQSEVAQAIAREVLVTVAPEEVSRLARVRQVHPDAYEAYLKGRFWWNKRTEAGYEKAREYFQQAIQQDPAYALAYSGLADGYATPAVKGLVRPQEAYTDARQAATKALELDDTLAEAHASLAYIKTFHDWDWSGAEREFKRAIELSPGYASAHQWYSILLVFLGRRDEALAEARRSRQLDPLSLIINRDLGWMLYLVGDYEQAIEQLRKTLDMDPSFVQAHVSLGMAFLAKGLPQDAIAHGQKAVELSPGETYGLAGLGRIYAFSGKKAEALRILDLLNERSKTRYVAAFDLATIHLGLGDRDRALAWLERAYEERSAALGYISVYPMFDPLRSEPRFQDLLRRIDLPARNHRGRKSAEPSIRPG